jgi:hypothetical protein
LAEGGTFGVYLKKAPVRVEVDGKELTGRQYRYEGQLLSVELHKNGNGTRTVKISW